MILCCALRFVGAEREAVCELFAGGEMVLCLAHWHLYVLQFDPVLQVLFLCQRAFWFHSLRCFS